MRFTANLSAAVGFFAIAATACQAADLTVEVTGITEATGNVRVALYDGAEGFPRDRKPRAGQDIAAQISSVAVTFKDLQPGQYAVAVYQDLDGDEELTSNLMGIPTEPYGFSRDARGTFGPPGFDDAAIALGDEDQAISLSLVE